MRSVRLLHEECALFFLRNFALGLSCIVTRSRGAYDPVHHFEAIRVYGNMHEYAYYFIDLVIGTPLQRVSVIIDTGSALAAFPCKGCSHCGKHIDPAFDVAASSTARWLHCGENCSEECKDGHCTYHMSYGEGSAIDGFWFEDYVQLDDAIQRNPPVRSKMGCHYNENKLFYNQTVNGILGLAPSGTTLLHDLLADHQHVESSIFALCLGEWGGSLVVGGHNVSYHMGPIQYLPLITESGNYAIPITAIKVDGQEVTTQLGKTAMVDCGTTRTFMGTEPYQALCNAIESFCNTKGCNASQQGPGSCWTVREPTEVARFPKVEVVVQNMSINWIPGAYMYRAGDETSTTWCYSFKDDGPGADTILGISWMLQNEVIFDMQHGLLGVAPAACPEQRERPAAPAPQERNGAAWEVQVVVSGRTVAVSVAWWQAALVLGITLLILAYLVHRLLCRSGHACAKLREGESSQGHVQSH